MFYKFVKDGREELVKKERWGWGVVYDDGAEFKQFDDNGFFHQIGEVDQARIAIAVFYCLDDMRKRISIPWKKGMRLIHRYRHTVLRHGQSDEARLQTYIFGYKDGSTHSYLFVLPDDSIIFSPTDEITLTDFVA